MKYLGLALFAEGPTDHRFLSPVIHRLCEEICLFYGKTSVNVGDVIALHSPAEMADQSREDRILAAADTSKDAWHILFIHSDGDADPSRARAECCIPAQNAISEKLNRQKRTTVAVIPVRETEAWCLVDGETLREVFGTRRKDKDLGLPKHPRDVEKLSDPKQTLDRVCRQAISGGRRRKQRKAAAFFDQIGEYVSLEMLDQVPAFQELRQELQSALTDLGVIGVNSP